MSDEVGQLPVHGHSHGLDSKSLDENDGENPDQTDPGHRRGKLSHVWLPDKKREARRGRLPAKSDARGRKERLELSTSPYGVVQEGDKVKWVGGGNRHKAGHTVMPRRGISVNLPFK